jgi:hypothetical protein
MTLCHSPALPLPCCMHMSSNARRSPRKRGHANQVLCHNSLPILVSTWWAKLSHLSYKFFLWRTSHCHSMLFLLAFTVLFFLSTSSTSHAFLFSCFLACPHALVPMINSHSLASLGVSWMLRERSLRSR